MSKMVGPNRSAHAENQEAKAEEWGATREVLGLIAGNRTRCSTELQKSSGVSTPPREQAPRNGKAHLGLVGFPEGRIVPGLCAEGLETRSSSGSLECEP